MSSASAASSSTPPTAEAEHISRDWRSTASTFVAGALAGACSRTFTAPLDRIKIIVQEGHLVDSGPHKKLNPTAGARLWDVCTMIRNDGGWKAFWRGNGVNCMKAGPEFALVFSLRRFMLSEMADRKELEQMWIAEKADPPMISLLSVPSLVMHFSVGALAGAGAQLVLYPLEVVKTRIAVSTSNEFSGGAREVVSEAFRKGGLREFYKGLLPNMVGIFLFRGFEMGIYSFSQATIVARRRGEGLSKSDSQLSIAETAAVGTWASIFAQTITYPLNVVRTRMQTQGLQGRVIRYCGMCDCMWQVYYMNGIQGLFSGLGANYLKAAPASAIAFVVFEQVQRMLLGVE